jgi:ZIP family zinc transporter
MSPLAMLFLAATATGSATAVGAVPFLLAREVPRRVYDTLLGFGAGLMLAAATLGLLPAALHSVRATGVVDGGRLLQVLVGFGVGVAVLFLMDRKIPHQHAGGHHHHQEGDYDRTGHDHCHHATVDDRARHQGLLVLGAMSLHRLPEGFAIGAGFASGATRPLGLMLAVAIAVQNVVEGVVMAAPLRRGGLASGRLVGLVGATGLAVPVAAIGGYLLSGIDGVLPVALSLAAGALIYLTCNEIIPESHSHKNERRATFGLLAGFVFIILLQMALGHVE